MTDQASGRPRADDLSCDVCGHLPRPTKTRLTLANVAAMLPIELAVHAIVVRSELSYVAKVLVLTLAATVLVIWVAEPSAMRLLRRWLHAPALKQRGRLSAAPALWRLRTVISDEPGALQAVTAELSRLGANILDLHVHPVPDGAVDELVVATTETVSSEDLLAAVSAGGGVDTRVWPTTALALADSQTKALSLSVRVAADPSELPLAVAELLRADIVTDRLTAPHPGRSVPGDGTVMKIPSPWHGAFMFSRPGEPFTPAESARAHRLAELAEQAELSAALRERSGAATRQRPAAPGGRS